MSDSLRTRSALAERLRSLRQVIAQEVTDEFFRRHPDWLEKYGVTGRTRGIEDASFHIGFLAAAIEGGAVSAFEDYARWTSAMLRSRNIAPHFVAENFRQLAQTFSPHLDGPQNALIHEYVEAGVAASGQSLAPSDVPASKHLPTQRLFLQAVLSGQRAAAANIAMQAFNEGCDFTTTYVDILQETLYEVGRKWAANEITVAEEHMATVITQYVMSRLYARMPPASVNHGNVVITGVEDELHQVGANMVADVLESDGWNVRFLGTNMPHAGIIQAVAEHGADVLGISATMLFNLPAAIRLVKEVRSQLLEKAPRIVLGGRAFLSVPELCVELGVEGIGRNIAQAQTLFESLSISTSQVSLAGK